MPALQVEVVVNLASVQMQLDHYATAQALFDRAVLVAETRGLLPELANALNAAGLLARERGDVPVARDQLERSLALYRRLGDGANTASVLITLAGVAILQEEPDRAERLLHDVAELNTFDAEPGSRGWYLEHQGHIAQLRGDYEGAKRLHGASAELFAQAIGERFPGLIFIWHDLAEVALALGDESAAQLWLGRSLSRSVELGNQMVLAWCLSSAGSLAALRGDGRQAAELWAAGTALRSRTGWRSALAVRAEEERRSAAVRTQLGDAAFDTAWSTGHSRRLEEAVMQARRIGEC